MVYKEINEQVNGQDELVRWTAGLGAVTAGALAHRFDVGLASARARLRAAERAGLLTSSRPLAGRLALYTATRAGLRAIGARGIEPCRVSASNATHLAACAGVAAALARCYPDHRVQGERELRRDEREHGASLASATLGATSGERWQLHRPDLVLWTCEPSEVLPVAVEVELTVKAPRRLLEICRAWARCRQIDGVLYLVAPEVERALRRAVEQARATEKLVILPLAILRQAPFD